MRLRVLFDVCIGRDRVLVDVVIRTECWDFMDFVHGGGGNDYELHRISHRTLVTLEEALLATTQNSFSCYFL